MIGNVSGRGSAVGLGTRCLFEGSGFEIPCGYEAHPPFCTMDRTSLFWGIKRPERGAVHPPNSSARVEHGYSCATTSLLCLLGISRDSFTFL